MNGTLLTWYVNFKLLAGFIDSIVKRMCINSDPTGVLSGIRKSKRREWENTRICTNVCLCAIILDPSIGDSRVNTLCSRDIAGERVLLPNNRRDSIINDPSQDFGD